MPRPPGTPRFTSTLAAPGDAPPGRGGRALSGPAQLARRRRADALRGALSVIVPVALIGGGIAILAVQRQNRDAAIVQGATQATHSFLDGVNAGDYAAAERVFAPAARAALPPPMLRRVFTRLSARHGPLLSARQTAADPRTLAGLSICRLTYQLRYQRGSAVLLRLLLARAPRGGWLIDRVTAE